jgi:biopolymer transport protein ExbD
LKRREPLTPDLTPIIDVVFILLIFFLVSSTFKKEELALLLNLPESGEASQEIEREDITIELNSDSLAIYGKALSFEEFETKIREIKDKETLLNIKIDREVKYERVVKLFDLLKGQGLYNLALQSEPQN